MATGSSTRRALSMMLFTALGLLGGFAASHGLRGLLVGVSPADPWTFAGATVLLAAVVVVASAVPAFRAVRLSPVDALRDG